MTKKSLNKQREYKTDKKIVEDAAEAFARLLVTQLEFPKNKDINKKENKYAR